VVDIVDGREVSFMFLRAGDIVGSEDVKHALSASLLEVTVKDDRHSFVMDDAALPRFEPPQFNA
jgi:hypothetical protein